MPQSPVPIFEVAARIPGDAPVVVLLKAGAQGFGSKAKALDESVGGLLTRACAVPGFAKGGKCLDIPAPPAIATHRIVVVELGDAAAITPVSLAHAGAELAAFLEEKDESDITVVVDPIAGSSLAAAELPARLALGLRLRRYRFDLRQARSGAAADKPWRIRFVVGENTAPVTEHLARIDAIAEGVELARTLVNLPSNHLNPDTFADYLSPLGEAGIEIEVLQAEDLKRLGMNALLAVGAASARPPRVIVLRHRGAGEEAGAPLAVVGKGVCFDSGGLCTKTGPQMFEMKGDMAGAAAVCGLMLALARQNAPAHVVGVLGIAENLPSGKAYKSGDVIATLSGQTVEVFDTDCEGRMLLADCLYYTASRFKPKAMIDLATLTYSVMRGLGSIFAGLFGSNDAMAATMIAAGEKVGERFWRMPLDHAYDEGLQSPIADLRQHARNLEDGDAPYAAAFLRHFTDDRPWIHLDIAGQELSDADTPLGRQGATGYGVQTLEEWITQGFAVGNELRDAEDAAG